MNGNTGDLQLYVEALVNPATAKGTLKRFRVMQGPTQVSDVNSKKCKESKHIPRMMLLLLHWKEIGTTAFSKHHRLWRHLFDVVRKGDSATAPFAKLVTTHDGHLTVQEEAFARSRVSVKVFVGSNSGVEGMEAIAELEKLLTGFPATAALRVSDPALATSLGRQLQLPHADDVTNMLLGKAIWLSRLLELHGIFHPDTGIFHRLEGILHDSWPVAPKDLSSWVDAAKFAEKRLRSPVWARLLKIPLDDVRAIILSMAEQVNMFITQYEEIPAGTQAQSNSDLKRRESEARQLADRAFTTERRRKIQEVVDGLDSQIGKCRDNLQCLLDDHSEGGSS